jgi:branched-chain amino acid aminotransferase
MINFNGVLQDSDILLRVTNRSFLYGDGVFETLKVVQNKILFFEDHYFRLMASMRIIRMDIPMTFTMEYLENQILELVSASGLSESARVRFTVFRDEGGNYTPVVNTVSYTIVASKLDNLVYQFLNNSFEVDLYKDFTVAKQLLSTLKTNNKLIQVTASIFAKENQLNSCLILNEGKNVVEAINGNLFMVKDGKLITPPISEGCLNGVMRTQILRLAKTIAEYTIVEAPISPFDLQKADELFITNVIIGIQPITKYRKKEFGFSVAKQLMEKLNASVAID